jgi:hypothetical protein
MDNNTIEVRIFSSCIQASRLQCFLIRSITFLLSFFTLFPCNAKNEMVKTIYELFVGMGTILFRV